MSIINTNIGNSGYYQLNNPSGNTTGGSGVTPTLASSLLQGNSADPSNYSAAYLLDLSPEAQKYLSSSPQAASSTLPGQQQSFTLTAAQREQINQILEKYKDQPFTQETFNKIQDELTQAGLGPQQMSMIDKATSFNPTQILIDALTGRSNNQSSTSDQTQQAKVDNYLQQIVGQWKSISTTVNEDGSATGDIARDAVAATGGTAGS